MPTRTEHQHLVSDTVHGGVMEPQPESGNHERAALDRIVDAHLRAEHDGDLAAILGSMADAVVHDVVGSPHGAMEERETIRRHYREALGATVHECDVPLRRLYGEGFVLDEHLWRGRVIGRAFDLDGRGRWISYRVLWLLEIRDGRIVRQTVWNDLAAVQRQLA